MFFHPLLLATAFAAAATPWPRVLLPTGNGAVALDGSPAALYLRPGVGANASNVILFFEGGGWCETLLDCADRAKTALGSSTFLTDGYAARDLLQSNCTANPYFCGWSAVYAQYLDGTSRAGDGASPTVVNASSTIYFRGYRANEGKIEVDVRSVTPPQLIVVAERFKQLFSGEKA